MSVVHPPQLDKIVKYLVAPIASAGAAAIDTILMVAASSYRSQPIDREMTVPTGFDPHGAALFESIVEATYLVTTANEPLLEGACTLLVTILHQACGAGVSERQIQALLADLEEQRSQDGVAYRVKMIGRTVQDAAQRREVLRIATVVAYATRSGNGVDDAAHQVLLQLADTFAIAASDLTIELKAIAYALADE